MWLVVGLFLLVGGALCLLAWLHPEWLGVRAGSPEQRNWLVASLGLPLALVSLIGGYRLLGRRVGESAYQQLKADDQPSAQAAPQAEAVSPQSKLAGLRADMREHYGRFWRSKVRVLLVVA